MHTELAALKPLGIWRTRSGIISSEYYSQHLVYRNTQKIGAVQLELNMHTYYFFFHDLRLSFLSVDDWKIILEIYHNITN